VITPHSQATGGVANCLLAVAVHHGFGNHASNLSFSNIVTAMKYLWVSVSFAALSAGIAKAAVVAFLLAIQGSSPAFQRWSWLLYFIAITNVALNIAVFFIIIFQCNPAEASWNFTLKGNCYARDHLFGPVGLTQSCELPFPLKILDRHEGTNYISFPAWNAVSDLILAIYPVFIVYNRQISLRLKIFLCGIMGLGVIASAFSFVKLEPLSTVVKQVPTDPTYQLFSICIWGQVELWIVMIALSIPSVWPLLKPCLAGVKTVGSGSRTARGTSRTGLNSHKGTWKPVAGGEETDPYKMRSLSSNVSYTEREPFNQGAYGGITATTDVRVTSRRHNDLSPGALV
jgi:hypothetical protein